MSVLFSIFVRLAPVVVVIVVGVVFVVCVCVVVVDILPSEVKKKMILSTSVVQANRY